jgi:hypothetical protein
MKPRKNPEENGTPNRFECGVGGGGGGRGWGSPVPFAFDNPSLPEATLAKPRAFTTFSRSVDADAARLAQLRDLARDGDETARAELDMYYALA